MRTPRFDFNDCTFARERKACLPVRRRPPWITNPNRSRFRSKPAIAQCVALSGLGLAAVGVFTSIFNGRSAAFSALRQIAIGLVAAAFTFGAGKVLGVSIS